MGYGGRCVVAVFPLVQDERQRRLVPFLILEKADEHRLQWNLPFRHLLLRTIVFFFCPGETQLVRPTAYGQILKSRPIYRDYFMESACIRDFHTSW